MEPKKPDKYEQLLEKYNWASPTPPAGYKYGVGRGAKAFITTAELSGARGGDGGGSIGAASASRAELELFRALDAVEKRKPSSSSTSSKSQKHEKGTKSRSSKEGERKSESSSSSSHSKHSKKAKLSMEDVATLMASSSQAKVTSSLQLVKKDARSEAVEEIERNEFSEDLVVVSVNDVYRNLKLAIVKECENILGMGSLEKQTTWITNARAYREMGKLKKAHQTLVEGCQRTGKEGPLIWLERMRFLELEAGAGSSVDPEVRRRLAEEAVTVCPTSEELWSKVIALQPIHTRQSWIEKAVIAIPESEAMWVALLSYAPTSHEQKALVREALKASPALPLLWAKLAHLETYETGKQLFNLAAARHPSLRLVVEAAKFEESHVNRTSRFGVPAGIKMNALAMGDVKTETTGGQPKEEEEEEEELASTLKKNGIDGEAKEPVTPSERRARIPRVDELIHTAQSVFLNVKDKESRIEWINVLREAAEGNYVATASSMLLYLVLPKEAFNNVAASDSKGRSDAEFGEVLARSLPRTWVDDIAVFVPELYRSHALLCAVWYTILVIQECTYAMDPQRATQIIHADIDDSDALRIVSSALLSAPESVLLLMERDAANDVVLHSLKGSVLGDRVQHLVLKKEEMEEEEEEELLLQMQPAARNDSNASQSASGHGSITKSSSFIPEQEDPLPYLTAASTSVNPFLSASGQHSHRGRVSMVRLCIAEACVQRKKLAIAESILRKIVSVEPTPTPAYFLALSRVLIAADRIEDAYLLLEDTVKKVKCMHAKDHPAEGVQSVQSPPSPPQLSVDPTYAPLWVKFAVLKRSRGENIRDFLEEALKIFPTNEKLWFMRIEDCVRDLDSSSTASSVHGTLNPQPSRGERIAQLKTLCSNALKDGACRSSPRMWAFIAVAVSSEALSSSTAARALLLEATTTFVRNSGASFAQGRSTSFGSGNSGSESNLVKWYAAAVLGLASARVELRHEGAPVALQTVRETLRAIPQSVLESANVPEHDSTESSNSDATTSGDDNKKAISFSSSSSCVSAEDAVLSTCWKFAARTSVDTNTSSGRERMQRRFVRCVGELVSLSIDLEVPAKRGPAASAATRQWPSAFAQLNPLVLSSIAKLYYAASKGSKGRAAGEQHAASTTNAPPAAASEGAGTQGVPSSTEPTVLDPLRRKAVEQAEKAVRLCRGNCGDALAVLLKIAVDPTTHEFIVTERLGKTMDEYSFTRSGTDSQVSQAGKVNPIVSDIEGWVLSFLDRSFLVDVPRKGTLLSSAKAAGTSGYTTTTNASQPLGSDSAHHEISTVSLPSISPSWGPLWIHQTRLRDTSSTALQKQKDQQAVLEILRGITSNLDL